MQVQEAFNLYLSGMPVIQIEKLFWERGYQHKYGKWSGRRIHLVLSNDTYIGNVRFQGQSIPGQHEAIVSTETFEAVQEKVAALHYSRSSKESSRYLLTGLVYCARCGAKYGSHSRRTKYGDYLYYACYSRHKVQQSLVRDPDCKNKTWRMEQLDSTVLGEISKLVLDPDGLEKRIHEAEKRDPKTAILAEIKKTETQISRLLDLYSLGTFDTEQIAEKANDLQKRKRDLEAEIAEIRAKEKAKPLYAGKAIRTFSDVLSAGNHEQLRAVVLALIERIEIDGEDVSIHWNI